MNLNEPEEYIFQMSNYLATISLFSRKAYDKIVIDKLETEAENLNLKSEHRAGEVIEYDDVIRKWIFDVRPSVDGRPFFNSFFRWRSLGDLYNIFGSYWFRETESGYLILLVTLSVVLGFALLFILLPQIKGQAKLKNPMLFYFLCIGFAFMFIEIVFIQKMSLFLGHNSLSVSIILSILLISSGLGSVFVNRFQFSLRRKQVGALSIIFIISIVQQIFSSQFLYFVSVLSNWSIPLSW